MCVKLTYTGTWLSPSTHRFVCPYERKFVLSDQEYNELFEVAVKYLIYLKLNMFLFVLF